MGRTTFIARDGKRIALLDFSNVLGEPDGLDAIAEAARLIQAEPPKSVYTLTDVTGARFNAATLAALKKLAVDNTPYVRAGAVCGMGPLHKAAYLTVMYFSRRQLPAFDTRDEAMAWLVRQE
jgi:hypothetical protein